MSKDNLTQLIGAGPDRSNRDDLHRLGYLELRLARNGAVRHLHSPDALDQTDLTCWIDKPIEQLWPTAVTNRLMIHLERTLSTGAMEHFEFSLEIDNQMRQFEAQLRRSSADEAICAQRDVTALWQQLRALHEGATLYGPLVGSMSEGVLLQDLLIDRTLYVGPATEQLLGISREELYRTPGSWIGRVRVEDRDEVRAALTCSNSTEPRQVDFRVGTGDVPRWLRYFGIPIVDHNGKAIRMAGLLRDVTTEKRTLLDLKFERQASESRISELEARLELLSSVTRDVIWEWDPHRESLRLSANWAELVGDNETPLVGDLDLLVERIHPEDREIWQRAVAQLLSTESDELNLNFRLQPGETHEIQVCCRAKALADERGNGIRVLGALNQVIGETNQNGDLEHRTTDPLTGLPNRSEFMKHLRAALDQAKASNEFQFAVLFIDLDRFKMVNDSLGHSSGDQLLVSFTQRLEQCVPPKQTAARLGGDEFAILLRGIDSISDPTDVAETIHDVLSYPFQLAGENVYTSASIGIAMSKPEYQRAEELLRDADTAMYRAKTMGKAQHKVFDIDMHTQAVDRLKLQTGLQLALERREFRIHYQPVINLSSGTISGFEALLRWRHPTRGLVYPEAFIKLSEETGLITEIGWWVMVESCRQLKRWQQTSAELANLSVNINLSARQLNQPDLPARIARLIEVTDLDPTTVHFEITETVAMVKGQATIQILNELKKTGVQLEIDDFGTGYSSLSYLHRFPLDTLKIDRSFVSHAEGQENLEIIRTIVSLANSLGLSVTAEGVETNEQLIQMRTLRCDRAQGYFFSRPLTTKQADSLLSESPTFWA